MKKNWNAIACARNYHLKIAIINSLPIAQSNEMREVYQREFEGFVRGFPQYFLDDSEQQPPISIANTLNLIPYFDSPEMREVFLRDINLEYKYFKLKGLCVSDEADIPEVLSHYDIDDVIVHCFIRSKLKPGNVVHYEGGRWVVGLNYYQNRGLARDEHELLILYYPEGGQDQNS